MTSSTRADTAVADMDLQDIINDLRSWRDDAYAYAAESLPPGCKSVDQYRNANHGGITYECGVIDVIGWVLAHLARSGCEASSAEVGVRS